MGNTRNVEIILMLGSNSCQGEMIAAAQEMLEDTFKQIRFSTCLWTDPIGMDGPQFLNCAAWAISSLPLEAVRQQLKAIEKTLGKSEEQCQQGIVCIDIDLLQYDTIRMHEEDWERDYFRVLGLRN
mgnify:CR=1 FL=1